MIRVAERERGDDSIALGHWRLIDRSGRVRQRTTVTYMLNLRGKEGLDSKQVLFFRSPAEIRDTAFLTWQYAEGDTDDDQWTYLPSYRN